VEEKELIFFYGMCYFFKAIYIIIGGDDRLNKPKA